MKKRAGITRCDLVVAVMCVGFVLANVPIILAGGRERSKLEVCMANLRSLMAAWHQYADDNAELIPRTFGSCATCEAGVGTPYKPNPYPPSWVEDPHLWDTTKNPLDGYKTKPHNYCSYPPPATGLATCSRDDWYHAIGCGSLWKYVKDVKVYACPAGEKGAFVTYKGLDIGGSNDWNACRGVDGYRVHKIRTTITNPAKRAVFIDEGGMSLCSWIFLNPTNPAGERWLDPPPMRHGRGTTLAFVDGHAEYHKWVDKRTPGTVGGFPGVNPEYPNPQTCNKDIYYMSEVICGGRVEYSSPCPAE